MQLPRTLEELVHLAKERLYSEADIELLEKAFILAQDYSKNRFRFRNKKRPFLDHLLGTCAILMTCNLNIETVTAGLLHSVKPVIKINELNPVVGTIVSQYFDITIKPVKPIVYNKLCNTEWAVQCIQLANEMDMIIAKELVFECNTDKTVIHE